MICTLILVSTMYINPCKVDTISPWVDLKRNKCLIKMENGQAIKTLAECEDVAITINTSLEDQKGFWW